MYKVSLKARNQQFEYQCAPNVTPLRAARDHLFPFQQDVRAEDAECVR